MSAPEDHRRWDTRAAWDHSAAIPDPPGHTGNYWNPGDGRALAVPCPWCQAPRGARCVSPATGDPLRLTSAHHVRCEAAGIGPPGIAVASLPAPTPRVTEHWKAELEAFAEPPPTTPAQPTDNREDEPS